MALKVALNLSQNFKILKKLSLKNAIFSISEAFLPVFMQFCAIGIIASPLPNASNHNILWFEAFFIQNIDCVCKVSNKVSNGHP